MDSTGSRQTLFLFAAASLAAVGAGSIIMAWMGLPPASWVRNPIAWLVGLLLAAGLLVGGRSPLVPKMLAGIAIAGLIGTFLAPDQDGVHRWVDLGPLHVNMSALLLPSAIAALGFIGIWTRRGLAVSAALAALLILQPDASQATAFLLAVLILVIRSPASSNARLVAICVVLAGAVAAWLRPDPLEPVAEVEEIFSVALAVSPAAAALAAIALACASLVPLAIRSSAGPDARNAALALAAYMAATALAPAFGAFPVPLVGLGMSVPVGWWLGVGLLCAKTSRIERAS